MKAVFIFSIVFMVCVFVLFQNANAQTVTQDTTEQKLETKTTKKDSSTGGELVLKAIEIKGKIEKPGVIIMPKRVEPELGKMELERSFQRELKQGVGQVPKPEKELQQVDRVKSIKKTIERKRK